MSEPPEIRQQIEQQARAELVKAGADEKATIGHRAVGLQAGLQLALRRRPSGARRQAGRSDHDQVRRNRSAGRMDAAGHVRADPLAARAVSDRRDPGEGAQDRSEEDSFRDDADRIAGVRSDCDGARRRAAVPPDVRAEVRRARVLRPLSRLRARARHHRLDQGERRRPHRRSTSGSRPIPSASGITSRRRRCRRSTTT